MANKKSIRKNGASLTLAAASEAVGSAVGRAVGRVEQMMNLARQRMSGKAGRPSRRQPARRPRKRAR